MIIEERNNGGVYRVLVLVPVPSWSWLALSGCGTVEAFAGILAATGLKTKVLNVTIKYQHQSLLPCEQTFCTNSFRKWNRQPCDHFFLDQQSDGEHVLLEAMQFKRQGPLHYKSSIGIPNICKKNALPQILKEVDRSIIWRKRWLLDYQRGS